MLRALEWCPFLTSQLKKCQVSDKICPAGLIVRKNLKISATFSTRKKKDSIFLKFFFKKEFLKDMEIYQKKTNWRFSGTLTIIPQVRIEYEMIDSQRGT